MLPIELYKEVSAFLEKKCLKLWKHENTKNGIYRNYAQTKFSINNIEARNLPDGSVIFIFENNVFRNYIRDYENAMYNSNYSLDRENADDILNAMYDVSFATSMGTTIERYIEHCKYETCSYIVRMDQKGFDDNILRLDLFRKIDPNEQKGINTFTGGLFHALNHFNLDKNRKGHRDYIYGIENIQVLCARTFFIKTKSADKKNTIANDKNIKFVFFTEQEDSNVSFLLSVYIDDKNDKSIKNSVL